MRSSQVNLEPPVEHLHVETLPDVIDTYEHEFGTTSSSRKDLHIFLVACHQASVSIGTMSTHLGLDGDTIRSELLRGIEAWNANQHRATEAVVSRQQHHQ